MGCKRRPFPRKQKQNQNCRLARQRHTSSQARYAPTTRRVRGEAALKINVCDLEKTEDRPRTAAAYIQPAFETKRRALVR